jgi:hypothetical protein
MTHPLTLLLFTAVASFLMGRHFGRISLYEQAFEHAAMLDNMATQVVFTDYYRINRVFHWKTELAPGYFYYGFNFFGVKIGFTRVNAPKLAPH